MPTKPVDNQVKTGNVNQSSQALGQPKLGLTVVLALAVALGSCTGAAPVFPIIPKITFTSLVREFPRPGYASNEVQRAFSPAEGESLILTLEFEDGDGDIGGAPSSDSTFRDFIVADKREGLPNAYPYTPNGGTVVVTELNNSAKIPSLASDTRSPSIEGTLRFRINNLEALPIDTCARTPLAATFRQKAYFVVYLKDRANHKSNEIKTSDVFIRCQ
jgi:hypothetical protein